MCSLVGARGTRRTLPPLPGMAIPASGAAPGGAECGMTIIRDHSYLFVCLAAACGGARDPSNLAFQEHDRAGTAATADSPRQPGLARADKGGVFGRTSAPVPHPGPATTLQCRR